MKALCKLHLCRNLRETSIGKPGGHKVSSRSLGHKDISTTMIYSHLADAPLAKSVKKLNWVEKN